MAKRITEEQRVEEYFTNCEAAQAVTMAEKVRLILKVRKIHPNTLDAKPQRQRKLKLKEPEVKP